MISRTRPSRLAMEWFSRMDDVTLIAIFEHFVNPYVSMPMVGTCRRVFITWRQKRRQLALDAVTRLKRLLHELEYGVSVEMGIYKPHPHVRDLRLPLREIEDLIR